MPVQASPPAEQIAQFRSDGITSTTGLRIPFFTDGFSRSYGFPELRLTNLITESTPNREERPYVSFTGLREIRYSRPGLVSYLNVGTGPIRCVFQGPPAFGYPLVVVSGTTAYNPTSGVGSIPGSDLVRYAVSRSQIVLVASGTAYLYDSTTGGVFVPITSSVIGPVIDVAYLAGRFVYALQGTDTFYYSEINDAANIMGLSFETAESFSDPNVALAVLDDELLVFGTSSVQTFSTGGDAAAPFTPVLGRGYQRGAASRDAISFCDNAIFWIGDNRVVYRTKEKPERVSTPSIEDKLRQCSNIAGCTAFTATFEGHEFYVLNIPGVGTYAYDASRVGTSAGAYGDSYQRGEWSKWESFGRTTFRGRCGVGINGGVYVGDDATNDVWTMQLGVYKDGADPLVRVASAFIKVEEGSPRCDNLVLHCVQGVGNPVDPASQPYAEMRYSDDQGRTFRDWRTAPLHKGGVYGGRTFWQRLGQMRAPGRLVEIRVSDPVNVVLSHLELNATRPSN